MLTPNPTEKESVVAVGVVHGSASAERHERLGVPRHLTEEPNDSQQPQSSEGLHKDQST